MGLGARVGKLDRWKGWVGVRQASWVYGSVGQRSGLVRVKLRGGLAAVRVKRERDLKCRVEDKEKKK